MGRQREILLDTTGHIGLVFLRDSTTGQGKTGVAAASMSGDYTQEDNSADTALSFASGSVGDTYSSGKWAEVGNGYYFYHFPNAAFDALGVVGFSFRASGAIDAAPKFQVVAVDAEDAVRGGMTALPPAAADAAGGIPTSDAGALDLDTLLGRLDAAVSSRMATFTLPTNFSSLGINGSGHVSRVVLVDTTTTNSDMRGTDSAALATHWSASRAGYIDNLNVGGYIASQASVDNIQNAVRSAFVTPKEYQLPASGSVRFRIDLLIYARDSVVLEDPDSNAVTITVANAAGTSRSGNLYNAETGGAQTGAMNRDGVGQYHLFYEVDSADAEEQLNFLASYDENSQPMADRQSTTIVATATGGGFNTTDRNYLTAVYNDWADGGRLDDILDAKAATSDITALQTALEANIGVLISSAHSSTVSTITTNDNNNASLLNTAIGNLPDSSAIQSAADAALTALHLDHLLAEAYDVSSKPGNANGLLNVIVEDDLGVPRATSNFLELAPSGGGGSVTVSDITQAALAKFLTVDTGESSAVSGSVGAIAQGGAGAIDEDALAAAIANTLKAYKVRVVNPWDTYNDTLTIVQNRDYKTGVGGGPLKLQVTQPNVADGDVLELNVRLNAGESYEETKTFTGAATDEDGTIYAVFELDADTDTNIEVADYNAKFELVHVKDGDSSPLLWDKKLAFLPDITE